MIILVVADNKTVRSSYIAEAIKQSGSDEVIVLHDTDVTFSELEQYLYPSLFSPTLPVIHTRFVVSSHADDVGLPFVKKLLASPTIFIFEEITLSSPLVALFKKTGAVVHTGGKESVTKKETMFNDVSNMITTSDKKSRWLKYYAIAEHHSAEAMLGIIYWKVRDMMLKDTTGVYKALYERLITAHADAWKGGVPLELALEKVLLS